MFIEIKEQKWPLIIGVEVCNKSLGLIGLGQIGKRVALRAAGFNMKILANERLPDEPFINEKKIELVPLNQLLREQPESVVFSFEARAVTYADGSSESGLDS